MAAASDDTLLIIETDGQLRRCDLSGQPVAELAGIGDRLGCRVSADGDVLAVRSAYYVEIYDLASNTLKTSIPFENATALSLTSDGKLVAVGDIDGCVTLFDTSTGKTRWSVQPPGRHRWAWTLPAMFLLGWVNVAWVMFRRSKATCDTS